MEDFQGKPIVTEEARSKPIKNLQYNLRSKNAQKGLKMQHPQN